MAAKTQQEALAEEKEAMYDRAVERLKTNVDFVDWRDEFHDAQEELAGTPPVALARVRSQLSSCRRDPACRAVRLLP